MVALLILVSVSQLYTRWVDEVSPLASCFIPLALLYCVAVVTLPAAFVEMCYNLTQPSSTIINQPLPWLRLSECSAQ